MLRSPITRWMVGIVAFIAVLGVLRFKPWHYGSVREMFSGRSKSTLQELKVGYLPVTCHLTCPVTDFATRTSTANRFESQRFTDFPTVVESVKAASDIYAPVKGTVVEVNKALEADPGLINREPFGQGWIFLFKIDNPDDLKQLKDAAAYKKQIGG